MVSPAEAYYKDAKHVLWVKPRLPPALSHLAELPLPETDRTFVPITSGWVVPGPINVQRFQEALSATLSDYPYTAGRFQQSPMGVWSIKLTNDAIPVHITNSDNIPDDKFFEEPHSDFFDAQPWLGIVDPPMTDQPLLRIKLVTWTKSGDTSIGVTWCHALGDGGSVFHFFDAVSRRYRGLEPRMKPTFEKYLQPVPTLEAENVGELLRYMPHLIRDYTPQSIGEKYANYMKDTIRVDLRFTGNQITNLHRSVSDKSGIKFTPRDVLVGYLIAAHNKVYEEPLTSFFTLVDYRGVKALPDDTFTPPPYTAVGNAHIVGFYNDIPKESATDIAYLSAAVRSVVNELHQPQLVRQLYPLEEVLRARSVAAKSLHWFLPEDQSIGVNNTSRLPLTDVDFGYYGQSRYYIYEAWERYLRIWQDNPSRKADGTWEANKDGVRVFFRIRERYRDEFLDIIRQDKENFEKEFI